VVWKLIWFFIRYAINADGFEISSFWFVCHRLVVCEKTVGIVSHLPGGFEFADGLSLSCATTRGLAVDRTWLYPFAILWVVLKSAWIPDCVSHLVVLNSYCSAIILHLGGLEAGKAVPKECATFGWFRERPNLAS
jgi:hypothetical protein